MKSRRELKALLLASVATISLMSGCSKMRIPSFDFYKIDKNSELQQEFVRKLIK